MPNRVTLFSLKSKKDNVLGVGGINFLCRELVIGLCEKELNHFLNKFDLVLSGQVFFSQKIT